MQPGSRKRSLPGELSEADSSQCLSSTCWSPPASDNSVDQSYVSARKKPFQGAVDQAQTTATSFPVWDVYHGDAVKDVGAAAGQWLQAADSRSGQHFATALDAALAQYEQRRQQQQQQQQHASMDTDPMDASCSTDEPMPLMATRSLQRTLSAPEMAEMVDAAECHGAYFTAEQGRQRQRQYLSHQDYWLT